MIQQMLSNVQNFFGNSENILFLIFSLLAISGAMFMLSFTKVVHMVVSLAATFISMAGLYILLEAEFIAVVQVLIYAGAITILMIFGIMMTNHREVEQQLKRPTHTILAFIGVLALFGAIFYAVQQAVFPVQDTNLAADNTGQIGEQLFSLHVIPFELMSVLLTVAFIGAIVIAKREEE